MASRFPASFHIDFCYHPVRISKNGLVMYVPCGKCNGCLLKKANTWSFRLGDEIESSFNSIFFTLTYDNRYVPKMQCCVEDGQFHWFSAPNNFRFNGKTDVLRDFFEFYSPYHLYAPLKNYCDPQVVGYVSKSDIQLYLKLIRKSIYDNFGISSGSFRYYIISEYGPGKSKNQGKFRPHYHGIIFPCNGDVASFLLEHGLYENWQMCDRALFEQYTKYCDSGTRHYVTEYITGTSSLPSLLSQTKEIKPFRLSSKKNGSIGFNSLDRKKVCKDIESGIDEYTKQVSRIERNYLFRYPSSLLNSLFPKCCGYRLLDFNGLLRIYGFLYDVRQAGFEIASIFDGFCQFRAQDYVASLACLKVCNLMHWTPFHYVEVLDAYYYRKEMFLLRLQYEFQVSYISDPYLCIGFYSNWEDYLKDAEGIFDCYPLSSVLQYDSRVWFLNSFGFGYENDFYADKVVSVLDNSKYREEVDSIISLSDKSKKVNSVVGLDPHIV